MMWTTNNRALHEKIQLADIVIKGLALIGAAVSFFGYKTLSGFNNQNMSLILICERFRSALKVVT